MRVAVLFPTYRNAEVFNFALESILTQSHSDLDVYIFDNGLSDGYSEVRDVVIKTNDNRVHYKANKSNIGAVGNYLQLFSRAATFQQSIILAADCGLRADAVELMLRTQEAYRADWVRPNSVGFSVNDIARAKNALQIPLVAEEPMISVAHSSDVLRRFFSDENIDGELDTVTWAGALIAGSVWQNAGLETVPFKWHGAEQYVAMSLLVADFDYASIELPLEVGLQGAIRYGTERPQDDYTRLETIEATGLVFRENRLAVQHVVSDALTHQRRALLRFLTVRKSHRVRAFRMLSSVLLQLAGKVLSRGLR